MNSKFCIFTVPKNERLKKFPMLKAIPWWLFFDLENYNTLIKVEIMHQEEI